MSVRELLDRVWRSIILRQEFLVIFVPCKAMEASDAVAALAPRLRSATTRPIKSALLEAYVEHFRALLKSSGLRHYPNRVVLFAHPTERYHGFAANAVPEGIAAILPDWWRKARGEYEFVIAHVCRGATVLEHEHYREVFPHWVSYSTDIYAFLASDLAHERWVKVGQSVIEAAWDSDSAESAALRLRSAYYQAMADLKDSYDKRAGDLLNLGYFQQCLESIRSSRETV